MSEPAKKKRKARGVKKRSEKIWVHLPESVVEARVGLIPSDETDASPPPEGLTTKEFLAWHRGLPVPLGIE